MPDMNAAPRCQHIKDDGVRCKAPALQSFDFCFWHQRARAPKAKPEIPLLDNENAIQMVITQTLQQLQTGAIETKRATAMFYGLALAMQNVHKLRCDSSSHITSTLTPAMLNELPIIENAQHKPTADVRHGEGGRMPDPNHPDSGHITQNVSRLSLHEPLPSGALSNQEPSAPFASSLPPHQISAAEMPPDVARFVKKVLRAGPSHPKFSEVSRIYDRYISAKTAS